MKHGIVTRIKMAGSSERGVILPVVLGLGLAMLLLVAVGMSAATSGLKKTNNDEDIKSALSAAYAGVEDYQSRLALDSTYYKFGNPTAPFSVPSAAGLTLPTGANANPAFDATSIPGSDKWALVPDPTSTVTNPKTTGASYRYEVDTTDYASKGIIRLLSTGRVGNVTESVVANLKQSGFIDFLYFTNYETSDPILSTLNRNRTLTDGTGRNICEVHVWETPTRSSDCPIITFGKTDELAGPVHSNDTMVICQTTFDSTVTSSMPTAPFYTKASGCTNPVFHNPDGSVNASGAVAYEKSLDLPPTNSQMKKETRSDLPSDVPNPGCLYTGPTQITFLANGKMNVISPYTKATQTTATAATSPLPTKCGTLAALQSTAGATIPVLDLNLLYVQSVPSVSTDPNYWATGTTPAGLTCISSTSGSTYSGGFKFGTTQYPAVNEVLPVSSTTDTPAYSCRNGDLYVQDQVGAKFSGHMTMASDNYVYVTNDILYNDPTSDILGIVGQNAVWVWNPIKCTNYTNSGTVCNAWAYITGNDLEIDSAILSVAHTFAVQNYDGGDAANLGAKGVLTVDGSITQKYRGTVATTSSGTIVTGYSKNYEYDTRFRSTAPPKFLTPTSTTYGVTQYAGIKTAYNADGSPTP